MSRVFATGSADGIGLETVRQLLAAGHEAVGHARDARRAEDLRTAAPGVREVVVGDLTSLAETKAPAPARLVYLASGLEADGRLDLDDLSWEHRAWDGMQAYADSKLHDVLLALAVAPLWPGTLAAAVDPGWIRAKLGGPNAWDEVDEDAATQVWLVTSDDDGAREGPTLRAASRSSSRGRASPTSNAARAARVRPARQRRARRGTGRRARTGSRPRGGCPPDARRARAHVRRGPRRASGAPSASRPPHRH